MKKMFLPLTLFLSMTAICSAETLTLTTYYPAPFGAYDRLRLVPRGALTGPCDIGTLYVLAPDNLQYCGDNGSGVGQWGPLSGIWTQAGTNIFPTDPGVRVGIGTTSPTTTLDVVGGNVAVQGDASSSGSGIGVRGVGGNGPNAAGVLGAAGGSGWAGWFNGKVNVSGSLGVGGLTTSPASPLHVNGDARVRNIILKSDGTNEGQLRVGYTGGSYYATYAP